MNGSSRLTIMMSLPRAGKTTYCRQLASKIPNIVVVSGDDIRLALGARYNSWTEDLVASIKHTMIRSLLVNPNTHVIVDDCHTTWDRLRPILQIEPEAEIRFFPDKDTLKNWDMRSNLVKLCHNRAIETKQPDLIPVIDRMSQQIALMLDRMFDVHLETEREYARRYKMVLTVK